MYAGEPRTSVRCVDVFASCDDMAVAIARETPKSATTACPDAMRMFSGLMSWCTIPCACA